MTFKSRHLCLRNPSGPLIGNRQQNQSACSETHLCNVDGARGMTDFNFSLSEPGNEDSKHIIGQCWPKDEMWQKFSNSKVEVGGKFF